MALALLIAMVLVAAGSVVFFALPWLPQSIWPFADRVDQVLTTNLVVLGAALVLTHVALGALVWKFRDTARRSPSAGGTDFNLEMISGASAILLFVSLNVNGLRLTVESPGAPIDDRTTEILQVEVTAVQFRWYFRYAGRDRKFGITRLDFADASEGNPLGLDRSDPDAQDDFVSSALVLPVGRNVELVLRAQDVIHSFFVREFRFKTDAVPGTATHIFIKPVLQGEYEVVCAELCGLGHHQMNARMKVVDATEFDRWRQTVAPR